MLPSWPAIRVFDARIQAPDNLSFSFFIPDMRVAMQLALLAKQWVHTGITGWSLFTDQAEIIEGGARAQ